MDRAIISASQAADMLGISKRRVQIAAKTGRLTATKTQKGKRWVWEFDFQSVCDYKRTRKTMSPLWQATVRGVPRKGRSKARLHAILHLGITSIARPPKPYVRKAPAQRLVNVTVEDAVDRLTTILRRKKVLYGQGTTRRVTPSRTDPKARD